MGRSPCRLCDKRDNGNLELTDGIFVWPEGLAHYVEAHSVRLSRRFIDHVHTRTDAARRAHRDGKPGSALHVGQVGGALQAIVDRRLGDSFFGVHLNPGHQLHLDEWVNSPISPGSQIELRSEMALQCDIIPATGGLTCG